MLPPSVLADHPAQAVQWGVVLAASLAAACWDVRTRRIPNWLTGMLLLGGLVQATLVAGSAGLADSLAGCLLLGVPYVLLFVFAGGGAGDAKMMAAVGAWLGFSNSVVALVAVSTSGAILGIAYSLIKGRGLSVLRNMGLMATSATMLVLGKTKLEHAQLGLPAEGHMLIMPYGMAILVGVCAASGARLLCGL
jgi:prepilin peptidase CpaA